MNVAATIKSKVSFEDYLYGEQESSIRHEYRYGELIPLEATTKNHNTIVTNVLLNAEIPRLRKAGCQVFHENVITEVREKRWAVYPDIAITCDSKDADNNLVVRHPQVIIEVLSKSTAAYDRTGKFFKYQRIPSLQQYILVSQYAIAVEYYFRMDDGQWIYTALDSLEDKLVIPSLGIEIKVSDLYATVVFEENEK